MIKPGLLIALLLSVSLSVQCQVTFLLESIPANTPAAGPIYIAGDFNGWNPGNSAQALQKNQADKWFITLPARASGTRMQYKFTRGSWASVEKGASGEEISNRQYTFSTPDTVRITIHNWADQGSGGTTTAAENVFILSAAFNMPQFGRTRRIWIYLPLDYKDSGKPYPVIYMQDGQNVFDTYTAFAGEWQVDETLNALAAQGRNVPIVVAVDNGGGSRMSEYSPWKNNQYGGGEGEKYIDFLVNTLKPFVDSAYRTKKGPESTCIMGSSMGGLISMFGALSRPDIFGKAGIFSPSYWFSDSVWTFVRDAQKQHPMRLYQLVGSAEGGSMVPDMLSMQDTLRKYGYGENELISKVVQGAQHNEQFWRSEFREAYMWLFPESSAVTGTDLKNTLRLYPNPAGHELNLDIPLSTEYPRLRIFAITGACMRDIPHFSNKKIDITHLPTGTYFIKITYSDSEISGSFRKE